MPGNHRKGCWRNIGDRWRVVECWRYGKTRFLGVPCFKTLHLSISKLNYAGLAIRSFSVLALMGRIRPGPRSKVSSAIARHGPSWWGRVAGEVFQRHYIHSFFHYQCSRSPVDFRLSKYGEGMLYWTEVRSRGCLKFLDMISFRFSGFHFHDSFLLGCMSHFQRCDTRDQKQTHRFPIFLLKTQLTIKPYRLRQTKRRISQEIEEWEEDATSDPSSRNDPELTWGFLDDASKEGQKEKQPGHNSICFMMFEYQELLAVFVTSIASYGQVWLSRMWRTAMWLRCR